ncbi:FAD-binding oxidoreductase [Nitratireductor sp. ZSWI3]|uniref:NAD(P)/FAD-dependent oxidoreductase n=1 Tax=Nitratireductor sp. ZSWI3 TaxID=2966359 RepID=UPI00214F684B|nr:FAD-binding oxidoreductase [Nitratireductor sp. ZSWI3]MCR4269168.1 FAD-binding oxidoreductase [Nitratireductor sp. ZSWI3]
MSAPDVLVIGAGITGAAAALALAEMGASVEVVDRYGAAAMASGWTLAGVRQSGRHPAELPLARAAVARWQELDRQLEAETFYRQEGNLRLARNDAEAAALKDLAESQAAAGLSISFLPDGAAARAIAPAISPAVTAATWCPTDGHADPVATVTAYLRMAERRGARLSMGERVERLEASGGRITAARTDRRRIAAGAVLAAPGIFVNALLEPLGLFLPLRRPIVTVLRSTPCAPLLRPVLGVANADMAARQEVSGRLRVTSGAQDWNGALDEADGLPVARTTMRKVRETIDKVSTVLPAFAEAEIEGVWGGVLDLTPDALPVIDLAQGYDNLVVAAGFSGHGFGIGPVTGALAAQLVTGREPELDLRAFRFDRFAGPAGRQQAALTLHG